MRKSFSPERPKSGEANQIPWEGKLKKVFSLETLQRFFERRDIRGIMLAAIVATPACTPKMQEVASTL